MGTKRANKVLQRKQRQRSKDRRNRIKLSKPKKFKLFIDESGNTGLNIFDTQQPTYYSLGIITQSDIEKTEECSAARKQLQIEELHGNKLGLRKLDDIADRLISAIKNYDLLFLCIEIDKLYFGGMKFFDVIFDSGTNPGVGAVHCFSRPLKYLLMIRFIEMVNMEELKCFWCAYERNDVDTFRALMQKMRTRVADYETDDRTKTLINDAYEGAETSPEDVLGCGQVKEDSPNVTGFGMFIHELHKIFDARKVVIEEVIHDTQDQFGCSFEDVYRILRQVKLIWTLSNFGAEKSDVFRPYFNIRNSKSCDALQLADIFLFVHKKSRTTRLHGNVKSLHDAILERMHPLYMTREALWDETERMLQQIYLKPLAEDDMIRGLQFQDELEAKRLSRLRGSISGNTLNKELRRGTNDQ